MFFGNNVGYWNDMPLEGLLSWMVTIEEQWGEGSALELARMLGLEQREGVNPEMLARVKSHVSQGHARMLANRLIESIGEEIGKAADSMVAAHYGLETLSDPLGPRGEPRPITPAPFEPVMDAPHLEPELVWNISRAYWHEIVYRGMEIGRKESFWITGIEEFSYDEVQVFAQHIWKSFKNATGLDFTVPAEGKIIKFWLGLSEKYPGREHAPDITTPPFPERTKRLQTYIDKGGPSHRLMEKTGEAPPSPEERFYTRDYEDVGGGGD